MKYLFPILFLIAGIILTGMGYRLDDDNGSLSVMGLGLTTVIISCMWLDLKGGK